MFLHPSTFSSLRHCQHAPLNAPRVTAHRFAYSSDPCSALRHRHGHCYTAELPPSNANMPPLNAHSCAHRCAYSFDTCSALRHRHEHPLSSLLSTLSSYTYASHRHLQATDRPPRARTVILLQGHRGLGATKETTRALCRAPVTLELVHFYSHALRVYIP